jgi:hypothetical protein
MPSKRVSLKGKGADLFFGDYSPNQPAVTEVPPDDAPVSVATPSDLAGQPAPIASADTTPESTTQPTPETTPAPSHSQRPTRAHTRATSTGTRKPASTLASKPTSTPRDTHDETIAAIRRTVRTVGKEVSFVRMTPEEKALLTDIVYSYKRQGQKTSETEINRIAINAILLDYQEHGEQSVLARVLASLLA